MNVIKKYWDSVYIYVMLLVPGFCMCAGIYFSILKYLGLLVELTWTQILMFDCSQLLYLGIALFFIYRNKKDSTYISNNLIVVKGFIVTILFIQFNVILYLFASPHLWECTFLFFACITFLFDSKLMAGNIICYFLALAVAYVLRPEDFLPVGQGVVWEIMAYRIMIYWLTSICIMVIVYFVEHFLIQAKESNEENVKLIEKQLEYYKDMELLDREIRKFRHDIVNHFMCMEMLFENGKTDELRQYFGELQQDFSFQKKFYFSGNDIVDAILNHDLTYHCKEGVEVTVYGSLPEIKTVTAMDLCTLFSNILSNAITSANQCVSVCDARIEISFASGRKYFSIEVSNSVQGQVGNREKPKDRNHGYGVGKVKSVLEKYNGKSEMELKEQIWTLTVYLPI